MLAGYLLLATCLFSTALLPWLFAIAQRAALPVALAIRPAELVLATLVALAVHEAGFGSAARMAGFGIEGFQLGPFGPSGRAAFGLQFSVAPVMPASVRGKLFLALCGGPVVSFVGGCFFLTLFAAAIFDGPATGVTYFGAQATALLVVSALSAVPTQWGSIRNSGFVLRALFRGDRMGRQISVSLASLASAATGRRPAYWPNEITKALATPNDCVRDFLSARLLAYLRCLDCGHFEAAHRQLVPMVKLYGGINRSFPAEYALEIAYFQARHRKHPDSAWRWIAQVESLHGVSPLALARARAAAHIAEGSPAKAKPILDKMARMIQGARLNGFAVLEMALLEDLRAQLGASAQPAKVKAIAISSTATGSGLQLLAADHR
jgi:hypothetical protein